MCSRCGTRHCRIRRVEESRWLVNSGRSGKKDYFANKSIPINIFCNMRQLTYFAETADCDH